MNDNFVHHHVHSYFSELDGLRSPEKIAETVAKMGQPGISITDHGSMSGIPSMFRAAQKYGLIFTPGIESYWAPDRTKHAKDIHGKSYYHLTLLAHTWEGYQSLVKQQSSAWEEGFYHKPRIDNTLLEKYHTDITILTGCLGSASSQAMLRALQRGDSEDDIVRAGCDVVGNYIDIVGKDHVFVEVHNHNIPEEHLILPYQVKMAHALGLPLVAAHDTHYCTAADAEIHDHLLCMQTKAKATDQHRFRMDTNIRNPHFFLTTRQEMEQLFPDDQFPGALDNTLDIMERSHFDMPMGDKKTYLMPRVDVPDGETEASHLRSLVMEGARDVSRYGDGQGNIPQKVQERIDYELSVIDNMGFNGYFLIVRTIVDIMVDNNINKGPGRGSAPGSIVSYCLGITDLDPLAYNLFFERFLNPARVSMPDIDMDVDKADRGRLLELIQHHFGTNHVAHIANYTAMKDRAAITAICRTKGILPQHGHIFSDSIMEWVDENDDVTTLADAFEAMMRTNHIPPSIMSAIRERVARTPHKDVPPEHVLFDIIRLASELSGTLYSFGIHACGIIITDTPLDDIFPLRRNKSAVLPVCQYDKDDTEDLGAVKMDILGLKNLGICSQTEHKILRDLGENIKTYSLPLDDGDTYMMLAKGDSDGVFQLESDGMKQLLRELRPTEFSDITACVALYRPGPMGMNAHMSFAHRKNGEEPVEVFHPDMGEILHDTYGLCLAPDTIVHIANDNTTMTVAELATTMAHIPPIPVRILSYDTEHNTIVGAEVTHCWTSGTKDVYRVTLDNGYTVDASLMHPFLTQRGWVTVGMLKPGIDQVMCTTIGRFNNCTDPTLSTVSSVRYIRTTATYDITVEPTHTLLVNDGAVVSNCVYQEQIMSIAQHYAGYSASEADNLRKAMAKKNDVLMEENRRKFIPAVDSRFEKGTGQGLWDIVAPFASYAFNKSHAAAYALTSYRTAWLKCHYPAQFGAAIIDSADRDEYLHHIHWIVSGGTTVHLPDINLSGGDTVTTTNSLTLPFSMIERVGETVSYTIAEECERRGEFSSIYDVVERLGATVAFLTPLVKAGCFDRLHNRGALLANLPTIVASAQQMVKSKAAANDGFFALIGAADSIAHNTTPDINLDHYPDDGVFYNDRTWFPHEEQQLYRQLEKETLGFSHNDTVDLFRKREDLFRKFAREQRGRGMVFLSPRALLRRLNAGDIIPRTANIMGIVKDCKVMTKNKTFTVLTIVGADFVSATVAIGRDVTQEIPGLASGITGQSVCVGDLSLNSWKRRISSHDWIWANSIIDIGQASSTM